MNPEIIGGIAAFLTTAAYVPQSIKVFREKNTKSLSLGMYIMVTTGLVTWTVYGLMIGSPSLVIANTITSALAASILFMKLRHG